MTVPTEGTRQSVTWTGVTISFVILAGIVAGLATRSLWVSAAPQDNVVIQMSDYSFAPSHITWRVGETVTVTLVNDSVAHPGKPHEWMVGRDVNTAKTVFGTKVTDGFQTTFFDGVDINVIDGADLLMLMPGAAKLSGKPAMSMMTPGVMSKMDAEMSGFMPVMAPSGNLTISFTVPDKPGDWIFGCFQQSGQHFINGMRGTITVMKG